VVAGLVAGGIAAVTAGGTTNNAAPRSEGGGAVATAAVTRTTLATVVQVGGSIGYSGSYVVAAVAGASGTFTWLPALGQVIREGQRVYAVNDEPVPLLYGPIAAYRAFQPGMSDGADVAELTHDLIALGYGSGLTNSHHYSAATAAAVARWQRALGLPATGKLGLDGVVIEPGPIRVTSLTAAVGGSVGGSGGTLLTATGTTPIVSVDLHVSEEYLVKPGDAVTVVLPDGNSTVGGHITTVGTVATCPGGGGVGQGGAGGGAAGSSPCESGGSGSSSTPTVPVTVTLDRTPPGTALDQAPVNVNVTTRRAKDVLAVPINALLALAGSGYGVQVVTGTTTRLVGVTTGLYSDTKVQISGSGITAGTRVVVPAS
jgi:peptidoglycan hydrolase-like protein with peptidoglycan-binding domain